MSITIRDVAQSANVHCSTVSHVLNGSGGSTRVSSETRERVLQAAAELGYTVNRSAQQLKTRRGRVVGLLTGALENPFFARMVSLCSEALEKRGYDMVLAVRRNDEANDLHLLEALVSRQLDGLLLWSETTSEVRERVQRPDMERTVIMGFDMPERDSVAGILATGIEEALTHLVLQGRTRIGYLAPEQSLKRKGDPRHDLYCGMMAKLGHPPRIYAYEGAAFDAGPARKLIESICGQTSRPDALLCFNDMVAIGALMGIRRSGLSVPNDIALIGCDDMPLAAQMDASLSSIAYPLKEMCTLAVDMLLERVEQNISLASLPARYCALPTKLQERESSWSQKAAVPDSQGGLPASSLESIIALKSVGSHFK